MGDAEGLGAPTAGDTGPIAVVMSRFPKFTETFVVNEILGMQAHGAEIEIVPLLSEQRGPRQPAAEALVTRARFGSPWGPRSFMSFGRVLVRRPRALLGCVRQLLLDTWRRPAMLAKDLALLPRVCAISEEISSLGVRHVHAHFLTHGGFAAWCLRRLTGVPYSVVAHGSDVHRHRAMMRTKVLEAKFVAAVSAYNRDVILETCGADVADRITIVRCGIDLDRFAPLGQRSRSHPPRVLCVGTLHEVKGQRHLIEAVAHLEATGTPVEAELVGDGPDREMLESLTEQLGVQHRVRFCGPAPHDEVLAKYRRADVVVVPSVPSSDGRREGIPTVLMEAMASGVPVVASELSGIPELVEHHVTGLLVEPMSSESIADAVRELLDSPERAADMVEAARRRVVADYALTQTTARILELIGVETTNDGPRGPIDNASD